MTTPDSFGAGGATGSGAGGLAAGPGDDSGEAAVTREAETGSPGRTTSTGTRSTQNPSSQNPASQNPATQNPSSAPGTSGGLGQAGDEGPDLTEDDEPTAADR
jgi:hypothetical protein